MFCLNHIYEEDLKQIGPYLRLTRYRGLILNPKRGLFKADSYPDADFTGMYGHENPTNHVYVNICTGCIIKFSGCPVLCKSNLRIETALLTAKAEIVALAHNGR